MLSLESRPISSARGDSATSLPVGRACRTHLSLQKDAPEPRPALDGESDRRSQGRRPPSLLYSSRCLNSLHVSCRQCRGAIELPPRCAIAVVPTDAFRIPSLVTRSTAQESRIEFMEGTGNSQIIRRTSRPSTLATEPFGSYTFCIYIQLGEIMSDRAKLFKSGGSQAVRLPKDYRFEGQDEVLIYRNGSRVILEPAKRKWSREFLELAGAVQDFPYPPEPPEVEPAGNFDR